MLKRLLKRIFGRKSAGAAERAPTEVAVGADVAKQASAPAEGPPLAPIPSPQGTAVEESTLTPALSQGRGGEERRGSRLRRTLHAVKEVVVRTYAAVLLVCVIVPGWWAVQYLFRTVFVPTPVPKHLLDWQGRIDSGALRTSDVPGVTGPAARAPLGHYHRLDRWFQSDQLNGCTVTGCHEPLPHTTKMKVPAFANFHTTFLSCQMCHVAPDSSRQAGWVSMSTAAAQDAPAMLKLASFLETSKQTRKDDPAAAQANILALLRDSIAAAGTDQILSDLLLQFETSEPGSPVWRRAEMRLVAELPMHARGEYGAKLARGAGNYAGESSEMRELARRYLKTPEGNPQRARIYGQIHGSITKSPANCTSCHGNGASKLDFEKLGYSHTRAELLKQLELADEMQRVRQGEHFEIPDILRGQDEK